MRNIFHSFWSALGGLIMRLKDQAAQIIGEQKIHYHVSRTGQAFRTVTRQIGAGFTFRSEMLSIEENPLAIPQSERRARTGKYTLDELLSGITPANRHEEVSTGISVGRETR